jgi:NAD(P)-dependent dehydrogenase (short-subunit alcohol dehydrogenase family)
MTAGERRVAVVTGGAGGIGRAIVGELRGAGHDVCSLDLAAVPGDRWSFTVDVTDASQVQRAVTRIVDEHGPVEVLVTAAGTYVELPVADITPEHWQQTLRLHLGGTVNACRAVLPGMLAADRGHIVAVTSDLALTGAPNAADYAAAKGAVIGFVRALALELCGTAVRANLVAPGPTDTPMIPIGSHYREQRYLSTVPAGRLVRPEEIARAVRFLIEDGDFYVGQIVSPNAGVAL